MYLLPELHTEAGAFLYKSFIGLSVAMDQNITYFRKLEQ
jgi:hypothetical protein